MIDRTFGMILLSGALAVSTIGCGKDNSVSCDTPGGAVTGLADNHCTDTQIVDPAACEPAAPADAGPDGGTEEEEYGDTMFNVSGDDDDCKYHLEWTASTVCADADIFFTLTATSKETGEGLIGAEPEIEAFLDETHPAPNSGQRSTEEGDGVYTIGPVRFDAAGQWTVRFHLFDSCADSEASPHGHGAFFVEVN